jgi:hypothetical protein
MVKLDLLKKLHLMATLWMSIRRKLTWRMFHALSVRKCCINLLYLIVVMVRFNFEFKYFFSFDLKTFTYAFLSVLHILFVIHE